MVAHKLKTNLALGVALAVLMGISVLSFRDADQLIGAAGDVAHSKEVLAGVKELESAFNEMVLIHSSYALKPDSATAERFETATKTVCNKVAEISLLTHENPRQQARLKVLAPVTRERLRLGHVDGALIGWIRSQISAVQRHEAALLAERQKIENRQALQAKSITALGGLLGAIAIIGGLVAVNRARNATEPVREQSTESREPVEKAEHTTGEFLANLSHEIRTPLTGVVGMLELLQQTELNNQQKRFAEAAKGSADSLLMIIDGILDFAKIEGGQVDGDLIDFDLRETMEQSFEAVAGRAAEKAVELGAFVEADVPRRLRGDPRRLRRVLGSLIANSIKFTEEGEVTARALKVEETGTEVVLRFEVKDTGIGISPLAQKRLLQSFSQGDESTRRKFGGTGLGLTICRQLVATMGGTIGITSEPGAGATFWFTAKLEKGNEQPASAAEENLAGVRVLIVDDNFTGRELLCHQTKAWKMRTDTASDVEAALRLLREASDPYRVAIIAQKMPPTDAFDLARSIKSDPSIAGTRLVLLSPLGANPEPDRLSSAGFEACLMKPVKHSTLFDCIAALAAEAPAVSTGRLEAPAELASSRSSADIHPLRILLAEDSAVNQDVAIGQLRNLGYTADVVSNGREAIEALQFMQYDVVLMDCRMPEMDGYQTARAIREREKLRDPSGAPLYIVAMTASGMNEDRELCEAAGMNDYLNKPVSPRDLNAALERAALHQACAGSDAANPMEPTANDVPSEAASGDSGLDAAPVDLNRLRQLSAGDPENLRRLINRYTGEAHEMLGRLGAAIEAAAAPEIRQWAHKLGGTSATCGITAVVPVLEEMEQLAASDDFSRADELFSQVSVKLDRAERFLAEYLNEATEAQSLSAGKEDSSTASGADLTEAA